jgi:MOSC domain-containing protein YiiM
VPIDAYRGRQVRIGNVLLEFHRLRPPCGYLDRLLQPGAAKALGRAAGIGLRVVEPGEIRCGDPVQVLPKA